VGAGRVLTVLVLLATGIADGSCRRCAIAVFPRLADEDQLAIERDSMTTAIRPDRVCHPWAIHCMLYTF